jgi:integrase
MEHTRERGTGTVYLRGRTWWMQFYINGEAHQESTGTTNQKRAIGVLNQTLQDVATGKLRDPRAEKRSVSKLVEDMFKQKRDGLIKGAKSLEEDEYRWNKNLEPKFGRLKAQQVTKKVVDKYVHERKAAGAANGTINKEISILRRALDLAEITGPKWPTLPEGDAVRRGFLDDTKYSALAAECGRRGLWLRTILAMGASFGFRKSEMRDMRVRQVDLQDRIITLEQTKNGEARVAGITDEMYPLLALCVANKTPDDFVLTKFVKKTGKNIGIGDFRKTWAAACKAAGVPGLLVHDLRRTAARNLRRLGESEGVIMSVGGWKTRNVFERYNIKTVEDAKRAAERLNAKHRNAEPLQNHYNPAPETGTAGESKPKPN